METVRERILSIYEEHYKEKLEAMIPDIVSTADTVSFPIIIDGVYDWAVFDVKQRRFTHLRIAVAKSGIIQSDMLSETSVFCDDFEIETIPI